MISVLHIDTGRLFRGGQKQIYLLLKYLQNDKIRHYLARPAESPLREKAAPFVQGQFSLSDRNLVRIFQKGSLNRFIFENSIQIIHAHDSHSHTLATLLQNNRGKIPIVVTRRSSGEIGFLGRNKYLSKQVKYIAISNHIKELLKTGGVSESAITVIPDMIELNPKPALSNRNRFPQTEILSIGVFEPDKGFDIILSAISLLSKMRNNFHLTLVGDGKERQHLERFISERQLTDFVDLKGWQDDTSSILHKADLYLSASASEGLGVALIEALGAGLPAIASNIPPYRELIDNERNGLLFDSGNAESLAEKIKYALDNPELMQEIARSGHKMALRFGADLISEQICRLYYELVERSKVNETI